MGISDFNEAKTELRKDFKSSDSSNKKQPNSATFFEPVEEPIAPLEVRDNTYRALLSILTLSDKHRENLRSRGLSDEAIDKFGYKSFPLDGVAVTLSLLKMGVVVEYVPGFYKQENGSYRMVTCGSGILIPQRNTKGQIQGFQIRLDNVAEDGPRYISLSSRDYLCGAPSRTYAHFRPGPKGVSQILITEGALKADVISALSGNSVLSVPGVNSLSYVPSALKSLLKLGLKSVFICYDMDKNTNPHVQAAEKRLIDIIDNTCPKCHLIVKKDMREHVNNGICPSCQTKLGLKCFSMTWNEKLKGLDDYLAYKQGF